MSTYGEDGAFSFLPKQQTERHESSQTLISPVTSWSPVLPKYCQATTLPDDPHCTSEKEVTAKEPRKIWSVAVLSWFTLDLIIALLAVYFITFAITAYLNHRHAVVADSRSIATLLLQGAKIGTTVFTILYAAIVGRCLLSIAAWRLEAGCKFGLLEQLLSSRTVSSAVISPLRLGIISWVTPALILLWALSPIGSQAAQRVVYQGPATTKSSGQFHYMDTPLATTFGETGGYSPELYASKASVAFQSALLVSTVTGNDSLDTFGNIKIPLFESFPGAKGLHAAEWLSAPSNGTTLFVSHVGIPFNGSSNSDVASFNLETSYTYASCSVNGSREGGPPAFRDDPLTQTVRATGYMAVKTDVSHNAESGRPRTIILSLSSQSYDDDYWYLANLTCALSTTYIEAEVHCDGTSCSVDRLRRSVAKHPSPDITLLDGGESRGNLSTADIAGEFLNNFIRSTGNDTAADGTVPIGQYLIDPNSAYSLRTQYAKYKPGFEEFKTIASLPPETLSTRLTQLLNTYRMCALSPSGISGGFSIPNYGAYNVSSAEGTVQTTRDVLYCSVPWLIMLLLSSLVMLAAGLTTAFLNLKRRGPDLLDSFTGLAQASRLADLPPDSSLDSGPRRARNLQHIRIRLGDVEPREEIGHIAIRAPRVDQPVQGIQRDRLYC